MLLLILGNGIFAGCGVLFALACRGVIDAAVNGQRPALIHYALFVLTIILVQLFLRFFCHGMEFKIQGQLEIAFKSRTLAKLLNKDYSYSTRFHSGELMNRLTSDITVISEGLTYILPNFMGLVTRMIGALSVLIFFEPTFLLIFGIGGALLFFTTQFFREKLKYLHKNVQEKDGIVRSFMQDVLESLIVVKVFGVGNEIQNQASSLQKEHYREKRKKTAVTITANSGFAFIFSLGYLYALLWGSLGLLAHTVSFGTLTAVLQLVGQVQTPITGLSGLLPRFYGVIASAERIMELENLPDERVINRPDLQLESVYNRMESLHIDNLTFGYEDNLVLNQISVSLSKGDFTLIHGRSGIGKSTLLLLLLGVLNPTEGRIELKLNDGETIGLDRLTRPLFAYVPQGNLLLSGTIRESITFMNLQVSDEEIMAAARISCADTFITRLPRGLDTVVGEKGHSMSEGEGQRLAITRAILSGAPILLLDEATSALDEATEARLLSNLKDLTDKTCIIVSHKKAALAICNRVIRVDDTVVTAREREDIYEYHSA